MSWERNLNVTATVSNEVEVKNDSGSPVPTSDEAVARRYADGDPDVFPIVSTVTSPGDTTVYTPPNGQALKIYWTYALSDPAAASVPVLKVKLGAQEWYRTYGHAHWQYMEGAADETLVVNLSESGTVQFTAHAKLFTPA